MWGIYYQGSSTVVIHANTLIDNQVSVFPFIIGPASLSHVFGSKTINITQNVLVGRSTTFNCNTDTVPNSLSLKFSSVAKSFATGTGGMVGLTWGNFLDGSNGAPYKPWLVDSQNAFGFL